MYKNDYITKTDFQNILIDNYIAEINFHNIYFLNILQKLIFMKYVVGKKKIDDRWKEKKKGANKIPFPNAKAQMLPI